MSEADEGASGGGGTNGEKIDLRRAVPKAHKR